MRGSGEAARDLDAGADSARLAGALTRVICTGVADGAGDSSCQLLAPGLNTVSTTLPFAGKRLRTHGLGKLTWFARQLPSVCTWPSCRVRCTTTSATVIPAGRGAVNVTTIGWSAVPAAVMATVLRSSEKPVGAGAAVVPMETSSPDVEINVTATDGARRHAPRRDGAAGRDRAGERAAVERHRVRVGGRAREHDLGAVG